MTTRVMPPATPVSGTTTNINKTGYSAQPGQVLDVPDADAVALSGAGWFIIGSVGPSNTRTGIVPTATMHVDTTIGSTLYSDGKTFRDHTGKAR